MALNKTYQKTETGFSGSLTCQNAYCRVENIFGSKEQISFDVCVYSGNNLIATDRYKFEPSLDDGSFNFIKQAYLYLKTLPEFANATDV